MKMAGYNVLMYPKVLMLMWLKPASAIYVEDSEIMLDFFAAVHRSELIEGKIKF